MSIRANIVKGNIMKIAEANVGKMETELKQWGAKLDKLVAKVETAGSEVKIFTLQGDLVRVLHADDLGEAPWDGKNTGGQSVASGVYIVRIEGPGGHKTIKVAVQR